MSIIRLGKVLQIKNTVMNRLNMSEVRTLVNLLNVHIETWEIENDVRHTQDKEIPDNLEECSSCRKKTEHKSMSENSNKTDITGVDF